jgi:plastocyanin
VLHSPAWSTFAADGSAADETTLTGQILHFAVCDFGRDCAPRTFRTEPHSALTCTRRVSEINELPNVKAVVRQVLRQILSRNELALLSGLALIVACGGGGAAIGPSVSSTTPDPTGTTAPPAQPAPPTPSGNVVSTAGIAFTPATITISTGSTVTWQIVDATHNVTFGINKPAAGDIPDSAPGTSVSRTFSAPGTFAYHCTRHSNMTGQVIVQDGPVPAPSSPTPGATVVVQSLVDRFTPEEISVATGTVVEWDFGVAGGVSFKDIAPDGGNIPETAANGRALRTFNIVGDYDYTSTRDQNVKGRVRVR